MNTRVYGRLRVKTLKVRTGDNVGKRLNGIREFLGRKGTGMSIKNPYSMGKNDGDIRMESLLSMSKDLGIREVKLQTGCGTCTKLYGDHNTIGRKLKNIRTDKGLTLNDIRVINPTMVRNIEEHNNNSGLKYYMKYATSLGVGEIKIFV